ncbi:MAG: hypothetical protein J0H71_15565 [Rhizobiales bacterium]|nr:hypothetical protein [Hyphomicrobiales bacterium]
MTSFIAACGRHGHARLSFIAMLLLAATVAAQNAFAAKLEAAGRTWIDTCIAQRQSSKEKAAKLRKYCTCMREIVDNNEPFENITALERTYPPAHEVCWKDAGRK